MAEACACRVVLVAACQRIEDTRKGASDAQDVRHGQVSPGNGNDVPAQIGVTSFTLSALVVSPPERSTKSDSFLASERRIKLSERQPHALATIAADVAADEVVAETV